ncbi:cytochrome P450 315a1, mitochondrial [Sitodiplosis mosellana]|uniref:cytochrome P450 315a1, mitochondrial n=1 Tax=Sitodiplosis mosellana TaxID=263140 RepID=UPI00244504AC|nr:cytochrome P450 315a1, mitochondrial [Sitodiplosis mosellana]XP_055307006.1 cytochrome P450 315a1, mitochondrial [Sitodiplosis mosellana]XP_055307007.1 cytochrome P450 315a1, mitochondrial [Sitodiplosis mosellana]XP_055307008.1 cytochrome P450 315a1, mitochondrial [Sitodiplosis mosellana]XP_055307009.1 cytochrome P450 315a1, mitochondrial [Sitodiplosis mosellana]XP_055307010.1 cytochrome P450 315a1, mitochondrial [Sitodiplosis mosellana]XP_055307011.1 cytochrome P450 315a1, mitochondrial [
MLLNRRVFQNFECNRLRRHQIFYSIRYKALGTCFNNNTIGSGRQIVRTKSDIITHNAQIQTQSHSAMGFIQQIPKHNPFESNKTLPYEAIPCADPSNTCSISNFIAVTSHQFRQLLTSKWDNRFHEEIDEYHFKFGPIFRKSLKPGINAIFIKSPELLHDVFTYEGKYPKHPLPEAWTFYNQLHNCQRGLFFMDDAEWMETRKKLAPLMLRNDQRFSAAIECATDNLIDNFKQIAVYRNQFTELPQVLTSLYGWSIHVLVGIIFGNKAPAICNELRTTIDHFAQIVQKVFEDTVPFSSISPQLARKLHLPIWTKFERSVTDTLNIANEIIDFGLKQSRCDGLLAEMKDLGMTTQMIKRIFIDLIIAAGDTTAFSTQWALYLLSTDERQQEMIRQELSNTNKLDVPLLVRGTVRETLRLFPVATFIGRILNKDAILSNYRVGKHTLILISMYSAGRDETSFPHANEFRPCRWNRHPTTGTLKLVNRAQGSIPYAMGARNCIGQRIANAQMHIILTKLLRTFKIQLLNANEIDIVMRLIIMPSKPMRFAVKRID